MNHIAYSLKKMIMANTNVAMRIDEILKSQLQELMSNLGLDMTTFFTMAAKQAVREQALPSPASSQSFFAKFTWPFMKIKFL